MHISNRLLYTRTSSSISYKKMLFDFTRYIFEHAILYNNIFSSQQSCKLIERLLVSVSVSPLRIKELTEFGALGELKI